MKIEDLGLIAYEQSYEIQKEFVRLRIDCKIDDLLIFAEHFPVYTIGRSADAVNQLKWEKEKIISKGISLFNTNRGGGVTCHSPGQLVCYPIIKLGAHRIHSYLRELELILINVLRNFELKAISIQNKTGLWINNKKIASIGLSFRQGVVYHGFALNVCNDLSFFDGIIACGLRSKMTSIKEELLAKDKNLKHSFDFKKIKKIIHSNFVKYF